MPAQKFTELLPATHTYPVRVLDFWPAAPGSLFLGRMDLHTARKAGGKVTTCTYEVMEFESGMGGRAFVCRQVGGESRNCLLAADGRHLCDCEGFAADASRKADARHGVSTGTLGCKHLDGVYAIVSNRWDELRDYPADEPVDVAELDAHMDAVAAARWDVCPACGELGLTETHGAESCVMCGEVFAAAAR